MHLDVLELRTFYYRTGLGRAAQRAIRDQLLALWPPVDGQTVVGFGFAAPLLRPFLANARRVITLMPSPQGVMPWPTGMANVSVLAEETLWPLDDEVAERLIVLHGLETSDRPSEVLDECWRILAPEGVAIFIVPNRAGLWARRDATPFGFGRPYSLGQLTAQLSEHGFVAARYTAALFQPPSHHRFWLKTGQVWEQAGRRISNRYAGGVLMVEARKQVQAPLRPGRAKARSSLRVLEGIASPGPAPV